MTGLQRRCCGCFAHVGTGDGGDGAGGGSSKCRGLWVKKGKGGKGEGWGDGEEGGGGREKRWTEVDAGQSRSKKIKWRKERAVLLDCESVSMRLDANQFRCGGGRLAYPAPADSNVTIPVSTSLPFLSTVILPFS